MLKQSFLIVIIQIIGILLGFVSIYFVAGDMGPEVYSLVGIYTVVVGIILTFSHLGVETTMMREALYWKSQGNIEKIKEYTMQSIYSRFIGFIVLSPLVLIYLLCICFTKYNGEYLVLLLSFLLGACASALNDSLSLIIRSLGDFVFSQFAKTLNSTITKIFAIFFYIKFGAMPYLFFYALVPLPLTFLFIFKLRKYFKLEHFRFRATIKKIKDAKNLWMKSYLDYFSAYADNLLVSILFPSTIIGVYSLYKNLEQVAKGFIEGFFDVLIQKIVQYKGNIQKLLHVEKKLNIIRWIVIFLILFVVVVFSIDPLFFINLVNLQKYESVDIVIYCVLFFSILLLIGKNEVNIVALFAPSRMILKFGSFTFIVTLLSFLVILFLPSLTGILLQRLLIISVISVSGIVLFYKNRTSFYTNILK